MNTRLYLDVDGVINAEYASGTERWPEQKHGIAYKYMIEWAPHMIEALAALPLDLVWTTTWRDRAVTNIAPLIGYGHNGRVLHPVGGISVRTTYPSIHWKSNAVYEDLETNPVDRYIWIDDELYLGRPSHAGYVGDWQISKDGLHIRPGGFYGIQPKHIELMEEYCETGSISTKNSTV